MFLNREFEFGGTIGDLDCNKGDYIGVYIIALPNDFGKIDFNKRSNAYNLRGRDPTVSDDKLKEKWIGNTNIMYIGESEETVQKRMQDHIKFWNGERARAWGGRIIAQIQNFENLEVWYLKCENPKETEKELLKEFKVRYQKLPFANWKL